MYPMSGVLIMKPDKIQNLFYRLCMSLVLLLLFIPASLFGAHSYISETVADFTVTGQVSGMRGALVGTLVLDPALPVSSINISPPLNPANVQMYYVDKNSQIQTTTITGSLYVTYFKTDGTKIGTNLTTQSSLSFSSLDATKPISFYVLVNETQYKDYLQNTVGTFILWFWTSSDNKFASIGYQSTFTLRSPSNEIYPLISNQGFGTVPTPFVGGGLPGPAGIGTIFIGDIGDASILYRYNISEEPVYSLSIAQKNVFVQDIYSAIHSPKLINTLTLAVDNYQKVYLGQSQVSVRFYQAGQTSFQFINTENASGHLPFTLWVNQTQVLYDIPYSPWPAPLKATNAAPISLKVQQGDVETAIAGSYSCTITIEIISGI